MYGQDIDYLILILKYLPGTTLFEHWSALDKTTVIKQTGEMVAQLHNALQITFQAMDCSILPQDDDNEDAWKLDNAAVMLNFLNVIENKDTEDVIKSVIQNFVTILAQDKSFLARGIIHGDLHDLNLIVHREENRLIPFTTSSPPNAKDLFGIIDFGDMCISCYIFEVGQIIRDFMVTTNPENCYDVAQTFLAGYFIHRTLNEQEMNVLFPTILTALCQYYVLGVNEFNRQPDNPITKSGSEEACQLIMKYYNSCDEFMSNISKILNKNRVQYFQHFTLAAFDMFSNIAVILGIGILKVKTYVTYVGIFVEYPNVLYIS